jgi:hypothetical protein
LLTIDYGDAPGEWLGLSGNTTLRSYHRHQSSMDVLANQQDTACEFRALMEERGMVAPAGLMHGEFRP